MTKKIIPCITVRRLSVAGSLSASLLLVAAATAQRGAATPPPNLGDLKTPPTTPVKEPTDPARLASLVGPQQPANHPAKAKVQPGAPTLNITQVYYDEPGDGTLWARGRTYKCSFGPDGFTFIPFMGSDAPQNYPVNFALSGIEGDKGGLALTPPQVSRDGNRVVIDRGAVQEVYLLSLESVEQQFIFTTRPSTGGLNMHLDVQTELAATDSGDAIQFANDIGGFSYSKAVTIDAQSRLGIAPTTLRPEGDIDIHLPQALLASAAYPLTVDPTIVVYDVIDDGNAGANAQSDIVYDTTDDGYTIVWEDNWTATDGDIWSARYTFGGSLIADSLIDIDFTGNNWRKPRIANASIVNRNLVVAEVGAVGARQVWGRTREAGSNTMSSQFQISDGAFAGDQFDPDVGGDPFGTAPVYFLVVWQRDVSAIDKDVLGRLVDSATSAVSGGIIPIENTFASVYTNPSVCKSANTIEWNVAYQFAFAVTDEDIYASKINWNGTINEANYPIDATGVNNTNPAVSGSFGVGEYMVVYDEDPLGDGDTYARVYNGTTLETGMNLTLAENVDIGAARRRPHIDNNVDHIVVSYEQQFFGTDWDPYYSIYCYDGTSIHISEQHRNLDYTIAAVGSTRVSATYGSGSPIDPDEFGVTWNTSGAIEASYGVARNSCCRSDIESDTGDGTTDVNDLLIVINQWGSCTDTSICAGDIDGDLDVDVDDLLMVINAWGPCP